MIERAQPRRRASDLADARANRAATRGDIVGLWVASGQADAARKRREEWAERNRQPDMPPADATPAD